MLISCEKEGIYFDRFENIYDSTATIFSYSVYSCNEIVYEEDLDTVVNIRDLEYIKDSLQEIHKDKIDILYLENY